MGIPEFSLDELNKLLGLRLRCGEDHMALNWNGPPTDPYILQTSRDLERLMEFIFHIIEPRIADSIGAVINIEFADAFYEIKS